MLSEPTCYTRQCKHFLGVKNDGDETTERNFCKAFPDGIPDEIAYGKNLHAKKISGQKNSIIFEKK